MIETIQKYAEYMVVPADNDVLNGIQDVTKFINTGSLLFYKDCVETFKEFGAYSWDEKKTADTVIKENDHCLTGDTLVDTVCGPVRIDELVGKSGRVYCTDGKLQKTGVFHDVRMTQREAEVFEVVLADGRKVKATSNHPVLTRRGWVQIKDLCAEDEIACVGGYGCESEV